MAYIIMREENGNVRCLMESHTKMCKLFEVYEDAKMMMIQLNEETNHHIKWFVVEM